MKNKEEHYFGYKFFGFIIGIIVKIWYRPKIINKQVIPKTGPIVFAGNHKHNFDPLLVCMSTKRMVHFIAKKELHDIKFFGKFFNLVGTIPVDRSVKNNEAKERAIELLNNKYAIGIFPEGTRNKTTNHLLPFKMGAVSFAKKTDATIIPFAIWGDYHFYKNNLKIKFGSPFKISNMSLEEANEKLTNDVSKLLLELKTEINKK